MERMTVCRSGFAAPKSNIPKKFRCDERAISEAILPCLIDFQDIDFQKAESQLERYTQASNFLQKKSQHKRFFISSVRQHAVVKMLEARLELTSPGTVQELRSMIRVV